MGVVHFDGNNRRMRFKDKDGNWGDWIYDHPNGPPKKSKMSMGVVVAVVLGMVGYLNHIGVISISSILGVTP